MVQTHAPMSVVDFATAKIFAQTFSLNLIWWMLMEAQHEHCIGIGWKVSKVKVTSEMVNKKERCTGYLYYHHIPARDPARTQKQQRLPFPLKWNRGSQVEKRVHFLSALTLIIFFLYIIILAIDILFFIVEGAIGTYCGPSAIADIRLGRGDHRSHHKTD